MLSAVGRLAVGAAAWAAAGTRLDGQAPAKDPRLIVHSDGPLDLETPPALLDQYLTPVESFYVRSHMASPAIDAPAWRLAIDGDVTAPVEISLDDLRRLPAVSVVATLECAGNGRAFFDPPVAGIQWRRGAVGTARWTGVPLPHLLRRAGIRGTAAHLWASGADRPFGSQPPFVRNLPLAKALNERTLVAYAMNDRPLPPEHGFPARLVVPGWEGAYSVKWLSRLTAAPMASDSFWVASAYRYPVRRVAAGATVPPEQMVPLTGLVVKSLITRPVEAAVVAPGRIDVGGFAWAGEHAIARVDVSMDGGATWSPARLTGPQDRYAWRRFEHTFTVGQPQACTIVSRASDAAGNTQPIVPAWNPSGYLWNAPDVVRIEVRA
jgi:DMSO/TMAO reductase YedYZ molybdopterin-dependent catalytic subunit